MKVKKRNIFDKEMSRQGTRIFHLDNSEEILEINSERSLF